MIMAFNPDESPADAARRVIDANSYLTLATADDTGRPWATPVWFAEHDLREFFWVSRFETRHSYNIAERSDVALAIFDSTVPVGSAIAVYVEGVAAEVGNSDLQAALAVYGDRSEARGLRRWQVSDVTGFAPHRLYRATAAQVYVLDDEEQRVPLL